MSRILHNELECKLRLRVLLFIFLLLKRVAKSFLIRHLKRQTC